MPLLKAVEAVSDGFIVHGIRSAFNDWAAEMRKLISPHRVAQLQC
jgi:hypothetical protein